MRLTNQEAMEVKKDNKTFLAIRIDNKTMFRKPTKNAIKRADRKGIPIEEYNGSIFQNFNNQHKPLKFSKVGSVNIEQGKASHTTQEEWKDRFNLFEIEKVIFTKRGKSTLMDFAYSTKNYSKDFSILSKLFSLQFERVNKIILKKREPKAEVGGIK